MINLYLFVQSYKSWQRALIITTYEKQEDFFIGSRPPVCCYCVCTEHKSATLSTRVHYAGQQHQSARHLPNRWRKRSEPSYSKGKEIVLAGADERGTYYALQTFAQLIKDSQLPEVEIKDYPSVRRRGVVEGFYGTPWSHRARLSQLEFYGKNKMNTYIYGPKDDPYHSAPNWRLPYPEKEAAQLQELVIAYHSVILNAVKDLLPMHSGE